MADKGNTPKTITKDELIVALKDDAQVCIVTMGRLIFAIVQLDANPREVSRDHERTAALKYLAMPRFSIETVGPAPGFPLDRGSLCPS